MNREPGSSDRTVSHASELGALASSEMAEPKSRRVELGVLVATLVLGLAAAYSAHGMGLVQFRKPGAGLFPFIIGLILAGIAAVLVVGRLRAPGAAAAGSGPSASGTPGRWRQEATVYLCLLVYAAALAYVGFAISSLLLVAMLLYFVGRRSWRYAALMSIAVVLPFVVLFDFILDLQLPKGALF